MYTVFYICVVSSELKQLVHEVIDRKQNGNYFGHKIIILKYVHLKGEDLLLFFVVYDCELNKTKNFKMLAWLCILFVIFLLISLFYGNCMAARRCLHICACWNLIINSLL